MGHNALTERAKWELHIVLDDEPTHQQQQHSTPLCVCACEEEYELCRCAALVLDECMFVCMTVRFWKPTGNHTTTEEHSIEKGLSPRRCCYIMNGVCLVITPI